MVLDVSRNTFIGKPPQNFNIQSYHEAANIKIKSSLYNKLVTWPDFLFKSIRVTVNVKSRIVACTHVSLDIT